jgi:predicted nucleotide-binding protein (sugar kinase/HSP70/actin superfamily)
MGNMYIPLNAFFENLGFEVILPPLCSKRTLELGVAYSPEFACLPLKINIGNFIEALEKGADTIIMAGGVGPCRFGYYGEVQKEILKDLGFNFEMIILEPPQGRFYELLKKIKSITNKKNNSLKDIVTATRLAWKKALLLDKLDIESSKVRSIERTIGQTDKIYNLLLQQINDIRDEEELNALKTNIPEAFSHLKIIRDKAPVKVGIVGEIYTVLEPFVNLNIEKQLGELGVEVCRNIYITDWVRENLLPSFLKPKDHKKMLELARPFINCFIGGHGQESVAQIVNFSKKGFDGVIHLLPFTCMPEIVAKSAIPLVSQEYSIPVMTIILDEHSAETGFRTRLEAFVDMICHNREVRDIEKVHLRN